MSGVINNVWKVSFIMYTAAMLCLVMYFTSNHIVEGGDQLNTQHYRDLLDSPSGGATCFSEAQCGGRFDGSCVNGRCVCLTARNVGEDCKYERRTKLVTFVLSLFFGGWGADRFYLGYGGIGAGKLILGLLPLVLSCLFRCCAKCEGGKRFLPLLLVVVVNIGVIAWWINDWVLILNDDLPDANGYALFRNM